MVLKVNGELIEEGFIEQEMEKLRPAYKLSFAYQSKDEQEKQLKEWSKENVIERTLLHQSAAQSEYEVADEQIKDRIEQLKEQGMLDQLKEDNCISDHSQLSAYIERQIKAGFIIDSIIADIEEPSDEQIEQFYNDNKEKFKQPERIRVAHIVKHCRVYSEEAAAVEELKEIKKQLDEGGSFELLAGENSDCPDNGGDLGYIVRGQMVEEFEDVVFNLGPGEVSDIFRTRFGWHIAKVYERKEAEYAQIDQVRNNIIAELIKQHKDEAIEKYIDDLREKAVVEEE